MPSYSGTFTLPAQMQAIAADNWPSPPLVLAIGDAYAGGFYAGQISTTANGVATHNLVVGPLASAQSTLAMRNPGATIPGADSVIDGPQNTADMVSDGSSTVYPAAHFCNNLTVASYTDWYMPAKNELEVCYYNLKPTTVNNNFDSGSGINPNAVPARASGYTTGTPAQTSAANFVISTGAEPFQNNRYWTSTESGPVLGFSSGWAGDFYNGQQTKYTKIYPIRVRAIRRVAV